jgi:hypothetical protein
VIKKPGKEYTCALRQIQPESACNAFSAARHEKKSKSVLPWPCPFFDLLRLFDRFSCSKITQILSLEHEVVAMSVSKKPMVLVILDGYGYREDSQDNAIFSAKTPVMDALWAKRPHTLIDASGLEVGLPDRQMGNSEVVTSTWARAVSCIRT